jgi:class 3 adenylate cyclase
MPLKQDLEVEVAEIFSEAWETVKTTSVPDAADLRLSNHAKELEIAVVLYADMNGSTKMVDGYKWSFSAEVYKTYLRCAARIIKSNDGTITAYDGDRIMAIFMGSTKNTNAVRSAMQINWAVVNIIRPAIKRQYPTTEFTLNHVVGVDASPLMAARIGVRGYNDIVWVGQAANHAAKLTNLGEKPLWITQTVYDSMIADVKFSNGAPMWEARSWTAMNNARIYCSAWTYRVD